MEKKHTIGNVTAGFMITVALLMDGVQFLLTLSVLLVPLSWLVTFFSIILFWLWFVLSGVKYSGTNGGKRLLIMLGTAVAELVPFINALPAITAGVIGTIVQTRLEDARRNAGGKVTPRTAMAMARRARMQQAARTRQDAARGDRENAQQARHAPTNDNEQGEARHAA